VLVDGGYENSVSIRAISIHGHFYQPPREDPTTGLIPVEVGASPFANWNERIHSECYLPNAKLGNFGKISYNIGPTLFSWMNSFDPATTRSIIEQDSINIQKTGVGNAIAQPYHHTILPLASKEDKITQVEWGIAAFEHQFGRKPMGMWLPETAVDLERNSPSWLPGKLKVPSSISLSHIMLHYPQVEILPFFSTIKD
jgi:alpha-amylase/alpha-mannosidase (GH57 family)